MKDFLKDGLFCAKAAGAASSLILRAAGSEILHLLKSIPTPSARSPGLSLLPLSTSRRNTVSQESLLCTPLADLRCVSGLLGQALPRVSKAQISDSTCTSFSLVSSSSSSCFGKPVPMLSREFCKGHGGIDRRMREGQPHTSLPFSLPFQSVHASPCIQTVLPHR